MNASLRRATWGLGRPAAVPATRGVSAARPAGRAARAADRRFRIGRWRSPAACGRSVHRGSGIGLGSSDEGRAGLTVSLDHSRRSEEIEGFWPDGVRRARARPTAKRRNQHTQTQYSPYTERCQYNTVWSVFSAAPRHLASAQPCDYHPLLRMRPFYSADSLEARSVA